MIEPLADGDLFEVETPIGVFRMTKRQFCDEFPGVRASRSYVIDRLYHYPKVPERALKYRL